MGKASEMTKQSIADCFIQLVAAQPDPRRRIDVTTLVKKLEIDRKTFYNHFDNTTDLVIWIFRARLAEKLRDRKFYQAELDYPAEELHDKYTDLPCYARFYGRREGELNQGPFFRTVCGVLNEQSEYYRRIFGFACYIDFSRYVELLFIPLFRTDIQIMLGEGRKLSASTHEFLAEYHATGLWGRVRLYFSYLNQSIPDQNLELRPYSHSPHPRCHVRRARGQCNFSRAARAEAMRPPPVAAGAAHRHEPAPTSVPSALPLLKR